jgi:hypothetical protein
MISQHNVERGVIADAKLGCAKCIKDRIVKASHSLENVVGCEDALVDSPEKAIEAARTDVDLRTDCELCRDVNLDRAAETAEEIIRCPDTITNSLDSVYEILAVETVLIRGNSASVSDLPEDHLSLQPNSSVSS